MCDHYFIIPPPNGATSIGVCKHCNEEREMFNSMDGNYGWKKSTKDVLDKAKRIKEARDENND